MVQYTRHNITKKIKGQKIKSAYNIVLAGGIKWTPAFSDYEFCNWIDLTQSVLSTGHVVLILLFCRQLQM